MRIRRYLAAIAMVLLAAGPAAAQPVIVIGTPPDMKAPPLEWAGKLQDQNPDKPGYFFFCSAQFIAPRVLLTAAHCVKNLEKNTYNSHFIFFLQYQGGGWTHKYRGLCWSVPAAYSLPPDYDSHDDRQKSIDEFMADQYDYAMILVDSPSTTGYFPAWDGDWQKVKWPGAMKIGYPGAVAAGADMQQAQGTIMFASDIPRFGSLLLPRLLALRLPNPYMTQGTSGGGWIGNFSTTAAPGNDVLLSVTSFHFKDQPEVSYGPMFDRLVFQLLFDHVASGGCLGR